VSEPPAEPSDHAGVDDQLIAETIAAAHYVGAVVRASDCNVRGHVRDQAGSAGVDFAAWSLGERPPGLTPVA
jgi:hypothetical protein